VTAAVDSETHAVAAKNAAATQDMVVRLKGTPL
jgi:hypothetical protein